MSDKKTTMLDLAGSPSFNYEAKFRDDYITNRDLFKKNIESKPFGQALRDVTIK